jgi:hypothetical protein
MANITIKFEKEDITTFKCGFNYLIEGKNNISLIFTPDALEELLQDYNHIINREKVEENANTK